MDQLQPYGTTSDVNLKELSRTLWRRKWLALFIVCLCLGGAVAASLKMRKKWMATAQMVVIQRAPTLASTPEASVFAPEQDTPDSLAALMASDGMADRTLQRLRNDALTQGLSREELGIEDDEEFKRNFARTISVDVPKETNVMTVSAIGLSPRAAMALANAVCQAFIQWKSDMQHESVKNVTDSLQSQVGSAKLEMDRAENAEAQYKKTHHLVDITEQSRAAVDVAQSRGNDIAIAQQDLASQTAKLKEMASQLKAANEAIRTGTGVRDEVGVLALQQQLEKLEIDRAAAAQKYTPAYPGSDTELSLPQYDAQIGDIKKKITEAVNNTLNNKQPSLQSQGVLFDAYKQQQVAVLFSQAHLDSAIKARDQFRKDNADLPQTGMAFMKLQQDAELARSTYSQLRNSLDVMSTGTQMVHPDVQIAQPAIVLATPFRPNWIINLAVGLVVGLFLALSSVLLLEQGNRRIRDIDAVRRLAPGPVVGMLPPMRRRQLRDLIRAEGPPQAIEAYGITRANLAFALGDDPQIDILQNRVILVTSAVPGEGKSTTAAALARSLARSDKQVILVDADMRRPAQNQMFSTDEPHGLADVLGGSMKLNEAIVASNTPNLAILHSGKASRNPSDLLALPRLGETIQALREQADVVIVDAPASAAVADALYLSRHVDCILHVVGVGLVPEETFRESAEALEAASRKPVMFFVNRAPRGHTSLYRSYYSYSPGRGPRGGGDDSGAQDLPALAAVQERSDRKTGA